MQHIVHKDCIYDVTACDDTRIRRTVLTGVDIETARLHTKEIVYAKPRRLYSLPDPETQRSGLLTTVSAAFSPIRFSAYP